MPPADLDTISQKLIRYQPDADIDLLKRAYDFACQAHTGQYRVSGDFFISHPLEVANILTDIEMDVYTVAAALLHDVVEDTPVKLIQIRATFGEEITSLIEGMTKLSQIKFKNKLERQAENLRKMFLAMAQDIRVVIIKLADRLHNMRTLTSMPEDKQREIARETLDIYAPLAHRLGVWKVKWELEDLSLRYLEPEVYRDIVSKVARKRREREADIQLCIETLQRKLDEIGIKGTINGRPKHFYSIYQKMKTQHLEFSQIFDLTALRIIVDNVKDCYAVLGIVHTLWKPMPEMFTDYIAMPKSNMYQSLHTKVIGPDSGPLEVQIRTWEMHRTAEYGVAAHWKYKQDEGTTTDYDDKLSWLRQMLEWQSDSRDAGEFMEMLRYDLFSDEVFAFTPNGDVIVLPGGATPVDFAYRIHTDIGNHCTGSRVNGRIVPLDYRLRNGEIVEIITSKTAYGPSLDWLSFIKTSQARNRIRQWLKKERREANIERGRALLEREVAKADLNPACIKGEALGKVTARFNYQTPDDLIAAMGYGELTAQSVINKLRDEVKERPTDNEIIARLGGEVRSQPKPASQDGRTGVRVKGVDRILVRYARCCNPLPGDEIVGYVTRGRGVTIHRTDCPNIRNLMLKDDDRVLHASWEDESGRNRVAAIELQAFDRGGLLLDIASAMSERRLMISALNVRNRERDGRVRIDILLKVDHVTELNRAIDHLLGIKDVISVHRLDA
ncbi:MAG: bifunctional (p)ppGpp synthetase/guanosine-3',5'-bis(diphosphate) 3'-pyrophosphohydrolase [bacterium]|nr:bifunctional (p)ppGpp synthetase/guanosine-3',5'-bis(diphosphate) 3'-pyrophosphohydrolase [bacterium]